ncbi:MAG: tetratricopeptide repeat protein, partial [Planctomycetaceae bacterium]|nr:tetratricopeptide repeat protein [Planctomycetaceae bacterium]
YTTDAREVFFSRAGRAATVFAFAGLAFCIVSGRLPYQIPLAMGFDEDTQVTIDTLGKQLESLPEDARFLHTRLEQGDLLIWHGRKSFLDSRVLLFGRLAGPRFNYNPDSIAGKYALLRQGLLIPPALRNVGEDMADPAVKERIEKENAEQDQLVQDLLREFRISHLMIRLSPPGLPDYRSVANIEERQLRAAQGQVPDFWIPVSLGGSSMIYEFQTANSGRTGYVHPLVVDFRSRKPDRKPLRVAAVTPDFYETWVYRTRPSRDEHHRLCQHYQTSASMALQMYTQNVQAIEQAQANGQVTQENFQSFQMFDLQNRHNLLIAAAGYQMAIREGGQALVTNSNDPMIWQIMGDAYSSLDTVESMFAQVERAAPNRNTESLRRLRFSQAVGCYRQVLVNQPENPFVWDALFQRYISRNLRELAVECLQKTLELNEAEELSEEAFEMRRQQENLLSELQAAIEADKSAIEEQMQQQTPPDDPAQLAGFYMSAVNAMRSLGLTRSAMALLEEHEDEVALSPERDLRMGELQLELGEIEEAFRSLSLVERAAKDQPDVFMPLPWHDAVAISQLQMAGYEEAQATWSELYAVQESQWRLVMGAGLDAHLLASLPLVDLNNRVEIGESIEGTPNAWPASHLQKIYLDAGLYSHKVAELRFLMAVSHIESGDIDQGRLLLTSVLTESGDSPYSLLARFYLQLSMEDPSKLLQKYSPPPAEPLFFELEASDIKTEETPGATETPAGDAANPEPAKEEPAKEVEQER